MRKASLVLLIAALFLLTGPRLWADPPPSIGHEQDDKAPPSPGDSTPEPHEGFEAPTRFINPTHNITYDRSDWSFSWIADPEGQTTHTEYDVAGRAAQRVYLDGDGHPSATVSFDPTGGRTETISIFDYVEPSHSGPGSRHVDPMEKSEDTGGAGVDGGEGADGDSEEPAKTEAPKDKSQPTSGKRSSPPPGEPPPYVPPPDEEPTEPPEEPPIYSNLIPLPTPEEPDASGGAGMDGGEGADEDGEGGTPPIDKAFKGRYFIIDPPYSSVETKGEGTNSPLRNSWEFRLGAPATLSVGDDGGITIEEPDGTPRTFGGGAGAAEGEGADEGGGETPPGGAGDDGGEGADKGEEGDKTIPPALEIDFAGTTLTVARTPMRTPEESGPGVGAGADGGEGADEGGGTPRTSGGGTFDSYFYVNPILSFAVGGTLDHMDFSLPPNPLGDDYPVDFEPSGPPYVPPPAEALGGAGDAGGEGAGEGGGPFKGTIQPAGTQFNPPAPITIPNFSRDLQTDLFFGSGLDTLLPPTAGENLGPEAAGPGPIDGTLNPNLDPQLDTGSALLDGASLAPAGGVLGPQPPAQNLVALHNNFHANQQADLVAFQANQTAAHTASHAGQAADLTAFQTGQNTTHDNLHTQQDADHTNFHNLFPGGPGFGAQHGQFHAQQGQAHGDLHAQQAADLNAFQAGQQTAENNLHAQQNADLAALQAQQDVAHTDFHNANPGV